MIALTLGVGWASGINLYATLLVLGFLGMNGYMDLPSGLEILSDPLVMAAAGFMYCVEFFADKTPGVDSAWDAVHSFIRIPAGAILAAGAVGDVQPDMALAAAIVGGTLAAGSHLTKAGGRLIINASPEPFSNWVASFGEDAVVVAGLWTATSHPSTFLVLLLVFVALIIWLLPRIWRSIKRGLQAMQRFVTGRGSDTPVHYPENPPSVGYTAPHRLDHD